MIMARIYKNFKKMGVVIPGDQNEYNTPGHTRLATLLNLPAPHAGRQVTKVEETTALVQFLLTGPGRIVTGTWSARRARPRAMRARPTIRPAL